MNEPAQQITKQNFIRLGIAAFKEHELREIVATFCNLPGIAPQEERNRLKVELASKDLRITGLEETLKRCREQLIKVRDADPEIRNHQLETNQVIASAWHMLNFGEPVPGPVGGPARG